MILPVRVDMADASVAVHEFNTPLIVAQPNFPHAIQFNRGAFVKAYGVIVRIDSNPEFSGNVQARIPFAIQTDPLFKVAVRVLYLNPILAWLGAMSLNVQTDHHRPLISLVKVAHLDIDTKRDHRGVGKDLGMQSSRPSAIVLGQTGAEHTGVSLYMVGGKMGVDGPWIGVGTLLLMNKGEHLMCHRPAGVVIGSLKTNHGVEGFHGRMPL